ncbi:MAG: alpha/beta hydrolase [Rhodospirillaceae bacterium]|nr:alpha/beta hydrolase [Rhodospirillaceae bacterium]
MLIDRSFVRLTEGLVHIRSCAPAEDQGKPPLYMVHASPASAVTLIPIMTELGRTRRCIAPDTLGNGDSVGPALDAPDMDYYADSVARVLDQFGLDQVDLYGSHTGAHICCELAIRHPARVRKVVFDGIGMFSPEARAEYLKHYAPEITPDDFGTQFVWAWHFIRDQVLHFPYFRRSPEYRRTEAVMPPPEALHTIVVDVLKALTTYHKGYRAAFRHKDAERIPLITQPLFCMASEDDPLKDGVDRAHALAKAAVKAILPSERTPEGLKTKAAAVLRFLDG